MQTKFKSHTFRTSKLLLQLPTFAKNVSIFNSNYSHPRNFTNPPQPSPSFSLGFPAFFPPQLIYCITRRKKLLLASSSYLKLSSCHFTSTIIFIHPLNLFRIFFIVFSSPKALPMPFTFNIIKQANFIIVIGRFLLIRKLLDLVASPRMNITVTITLSLFLLLVGRT
jgi:hypothetical protein